MITLRPQGRDDARGWLPLLIASVIYAGTVCVILAIRVESTSDFRDFWNNARAFLETGRIRDDLGVHNYLPFFTLFMGPFGLLPLRVAAIVFTLLSFLCLALTVVMTESLLRDGLGPKPRPALLAAVGLMLAYIHSCGVLGQVGLLLLFLVVTTWFLVERDREWIAGAALGLAALIKILPAALIVFFLLKRRWRVAGGAAATCLILGFGLPWAALGGDEILSQHREFRRRAILEHGPNATILCEAPLKAKFNNNALSMVLRRLLSPLNGDPSDREPERRLLVNVVDLPRPVIRRIYLAILAFVSVVSLAVALPHGRPWPPPTTGAAWSLRAQYGAWCCLMLLAAPLLWTHYLVLAYWPLALAADRASDSTSEVKSRRILITAVLLVWLLGVGLLAWPPARAAGAQLWSVAALWLAMVVVSRVKVVDLSQ